MNVLTTYCKPGSAENVWTIYWRNGAQIQGILNVKVTANVGDREIVAELSALQWLLEHRSVFGESQAGKGLCLTVTSGAIKKLAKAAEKELDLRDSKLGKPHLFRYAKFLGTRFVGCEIKVSKDGDWVMPRADNDIETIEIDEPLEEILTIKGVGRVIMSDHAMKKFIERQGNSSREDIWRLLRKIANYGLRLGELGEERLRNMEQKYEKPGKVWVHDDTKWAFVVVPDQPLPKVVTVYSVRRSAVTAQK